jgi:hypothetical protein
MSSTDAILRGRCDACGLDIQQYCKQLLVCSISNQLYHDCKWFRTETKLGSNLSVLSFVLGSMNFWLIRGLQPPPPHTHRHAHTFDTWVHAWFWICATSTEEGYISVCWRHCMFKSEDITFTWLLISSTRTTKLVWEITWT